MSVIYNYIYIYIKIFPGQFPLSVIVSPIFILVSLFPIHMYLFVICWVMHCPIVFRFSFDPQLSAVPFCGYGSISSTKEGQVLPHLQNLNPNLKKKKSKKKICPSCIYILLPKSQTFFYFLLVLTF